MSALDGGMMEPNEAKEGPMPTIDDLLASLPEPLTLGASDVVAALPSPPRQVVVIDDHPTGSQSLRDVPVLMAWSPDQISWAMDSGAPAFFIVVSTRALAPGAAEDRYIEVMNAVLETARVKKREVTIVLRTDSSLRSHFPLDSDIVANAIEAAGAGTIDGVVIVPAFADAGRMTVDHVHYVSEWPGEYSLIGETRFGREPRFPFTSSDLREWVAEKTHGRYLASEVRAIPLRTVRRSPDAVAAELLKARDGEPIVIDAVTEEDLRAIVLGAITAEGAGRRFVYRVSPPFVRAMIGQEEAAPVSTAEIDELRARTGAPDTHGLVVVGTPVPFTRRQLRVLEQRRAIRDIPLSVPAVLDSRREAHLDDVVARALEGLGASNVVVRLADLPGENAAKGDFAIDPRIARALNEVVHRIAKRHSLGFVVARGGSAVSPVAQGLGVRRAMVKGPILDGIVSLWEPLSGPIAGVPFAVYAGGVGDDEGLADIVDKLSGIDPGAAHRAVVADPAARPRSGEKVAVLGLGSKGRPVAGRLGERFTVRAWDVEGHARAAAARAGVTLGSSAVDAVDGAATVLVAVRDVDDLEEVLFGHQGVADSLTEGTVVAVLMAVGIREIREIAGRLAERGIHLADCPLSGGGDIARRGEVTCLVGASHGVVEAIRPVLEHVAATVIVAGEAVGDGQAMKAVAQLLGAVTLVGTAEALSLAETLGLDAAETLCALSVSSAASFMVTDRGPRMVEVLHGTTPNAQSRMDLTVGDIRVAVEIAREAGLATPVGAAAEQVLLRAARHQPPDGDDSLVVREVSRD